MRRPPFYHEAGRDLQPNQITCPGRMMGLEVQQHLKDCLIHGVHKHICNSIWYLYSTSRTFYSQLMVTTHKAESKNEEIWDKVRTMVATDAREWMAEMGQQISKLMATMTKAGQGNSSSSAPSIPQQRGCGRGHNGSSTPSHPNSHNGRSGAGQTTPACSLPTGHGEGVPEMEVMDRVTKGLV